VSCDVGSVLKGGGGGSRVELMPTSVANLKQVQLHNMNNYILTFVFFLGRINAAYYFFEAFKMSSVSR
jgi:hypothetical protein